MRGLRTALAALAATFLIAPVDGRAEDLFDFLFGPDTPAPRAAPPPRAAASRRSGDPRFSGRLGVHVAPGAGESASAGMQSGGGFCVRVCDGYYFPLIKSEQATRQQSCEYACPSAPMTIYDGATIETARNHKGEKYTSLSTAFKFRDKATERCSCNAPENSQAFFVRIARSDPTLRAGDIVFDETGAFVYRGADFAPAERSTFLPSYTRDRLRAMIERARAKPRPSQAEARPADAPGTANEPRKIDPRPVSATQPAGPQPDSPPQ